MAFTVAEAQAVNRLLRNMPLRSQAELEDAGLLAAAAAKRLMAGVTPDQLVLADATVVLEAPWPAEQVDAAAAAFWMSDTVGEHTWVGENEGVRQWYRNAVVCVLDELARWQSETCAGCGARPGGGHALGCGAGQ